MALNLREKIKIPLKFIIKKNLGVLYYSENLIDLDYWFMLNFFIKTTPTKIPLIIKINY